MAQRTPSSLENLETSKLWKQAIRLADKTRQFSEVIPHHEFYAIGDPLNRHATNLASDIAMGLGRGGEQAAYEYRLARGRLFSLKSLVLMAQHYELVAEVKHMVNEINSLQNMLDEKIRQLEGK